MPQKRSRKKLIIWIIIAILVLGGAGFGTYYLMKDKADTTSDEEEALYLNPQSDPEAVLSIPGSESVLGDQIPTTTEVVIPPTSNSETQIYRNENLHFSIEIPNTWTVTAGSDEVVVQTPDNTKYSIQVFPARGNTTASLKSALKAFSKLSNVSAATVSGRQVEAFNSTGAYMRGLAFVENDRLYYLLGPDIENSALAQTLKTF